MSQQNIAVARRWVELFNGRDDLDEFLSLQDPEVELQTPGGPRLRGHDQVRNWFQAGYENVQPRILPERFMEGARGRGRALPSRIGARGERRYRFDASERTHKCSMRAGVAPRRATCRFRVGCGRVPRVGRRAPMVPGNATAQPTAAREKTCKCRPSRERLKGFEPST